MDVEQLREDLRAEHDSLDRIVAELEDAGWATPTPSPRWTVADQIAHLTYYDGTAAEALSTPELFPRRVDELFALLAGGTDNLEERLDDQTLGPLRALPPAALLDTWRSGRRHLIEASRATADDARVPWYGPAMSHRSFLSARLMETWAHGTDVADALGVTREPTERLRHIVRIGVATRAWSYTNRSAAVPDGQVRVELSGPDGEVWTGGPDEADETITGPAVDFCLVVTQRRHVDDTSLDVGPLARDWLECAQAFAGPATDGPSAGSRP